MDYRDLEMLEKQACKELKHYTDNGFKRPEDVSTAKELISIIHKATDLMEREGGMSMAMSRAPMSYGDWNANGSYYGGMSGRRGRNAMGQYTSYGSDMVERLEQMMNETNNPEERRALETAMRSFR